MKFISPLPQHTSCIDPNGALHSLLKEQQLYDRLEPAPDKARSYHLLKSVLRSLGLHTGLHPKAVQSLVDEWQRGFSKEADPSPYLTVAKISINSYNDCLLKGAGMN